MKRKYLVPAFCVCMGIVAFAELRIPVPASINGQAVKLAFDTGAHDLILWEQTALRLGIAWSNTLPGSAVAPGSVPMGIAEEFELTMLQQSQPTRAGVYRVPSAVVLDVDGLLGWSRVIDNVLRIDPHTLAVAGLTELPDDIAKWSSWTLKTNTSVLAFQVPGYGAVFIDTGMSGGVELRRDEWRRIQRDGDSGKTTLSAVFSPFSGLKVDEECWVDRMDLGAFCIANLPATESHSGEALKHPDYRATLGLFALTRIEVIIDGLHGVLYTRPVSCPTVEYAHNRMAAVFVPKDLQSDELMAHVVDDGPAHKAGLRNGDRLVKINDTDFTHWREMPDRKPFSTFWKQPAGTRLTLVVQRHGDPLTCEVTLEDILESAGPE